MELVDLAVLEELLEELAGAVGGAIVDDNDLFQDGLAEHLVEDPLDGIALVVDGDQHRQTKRAALQRSAIASRAWRCGVALHRRG